MKHFFTASARNRGVQKFVAIVLAAAVCAISIFSERSALEVNAESTYTVTYDGNGATSGSMPPDTAVYGQNFITTKNAFAKDGYWFAGWNERADGTGVPWCLTSAGVAEDGGSWMWTYDHNITLYAQWIKCTPPEFAGWNTQPDGSGTAYAPGDTLPDTNLDLYAQYVYNFDYTGAVQQFVAPISGSYKLEVWGAGSGIPLLQGGQNVGSIGHGGYSSGTVSLVKGDAVYVSVGGRGQDAIIGQAAGGWNGGGNGDWDRIDEERSDNSSEATAGGGGATSMQRTFRGDGQLKNYETQKDTDVLIVAGGAGSTMSGHAESSIRPDGGGTSGIAGTYEKTSGSKTLPIPGTQTSGYAFGQGGSAEHKYHNSELGAGGGGWYGGGAAIDTGGCTYVDGAGGSGHIGAMVTDGATVAGDQSFPAPDGSAEVGHSGNGYARITLIATD